MTDESTSRQADIEFSLHALQRMSERHVLPEEVLVAVQLGQKRPGKNDLRIAEYELDHGVRLRVIYDEGLRNGARFIRIVTVIPLGSRK